MKLKPVAIAVCLSLPLLWSGCSKTAENNTDTQTKSEETDGASAESEATKELFAMDTYMTLTAYGENAGEAVEQAAQEIERLDQLLSTGDSQSEIFRLNESGAADLSEDAGYLVERALALYQETQGAFNIAVYPVMCAWGFPSQEYRVPAADELDELLKLTDASQIIYDADSREISFGKSGMQIDLGGIAKGYTSSRVMEIYRENGIESGLVNLGGNVQALGAKTNGSSWRVAVQDPESGEDYLGVLEIQDRAVITSGGYERYFEQDGVTYHHIIDPETGYPAESGLTSVTIVSEDGTLADGLSTSLFVMGKDRAVQFWKEHSEEFDMILEAEDGVLYVSEGIWEDFSTERTCEQVQQ